MLLHPFLSLYINLRVESWNSSCNLYLSAVIESVLITRLTVVEILPYSIKFVTFSYMLLNSSYVKIFPLSSIIGVPRYAYLTIRYVSRYWFNDTIRITIQVQRYDTYRDTLNRMHSNKTRIVYYIRTKFGFRFPLPKRFWVFSGLCRPGMLC